jgi:L-threonylcarbamoyladenylate synthase
MPFSDEAIAEAARLIASGDPVAVPTETVYGLAADATNAAAVARIYAAKGRPSFNPLIVHVTDPSAAEALGEFGGLARELAERYWPGPLTLVLPHRRGGPLPSIVTAGLPTVAIRVPDHAAMQALLRASGRPLAAPSANASGTISPTRAEHVLNSLGGRIPLILDGGPTRVGLESTIVAVQDEKLRLLRPGPIDLGLLPEIVGDVEAPGMLARHYAPAKPLRLDAVDPRPGEFLIGFGAVRGNASLSERGILIEAAARLFDLLHRADAAPEERIAVAPIPDHGLGLAIRDRLRRAAHQGEE